MGLFDPKVTEVFSPKCPFRGTLSGGYGFSLLALTGLIGRAEGVGVLESARSAVLPPLWRRSGAGISLPFCLRGGVA